MRSEPRENKAESGGEIAPGRKTRAPWKEGFDGRESSFRSSALISDAEDRDSVKQGVPDHIVRDSYFRR